MKCSAVCNGVAGAAGKTLLAAKAGSDRRPKIKQIIIGSNDGTPADVLADFALKRYASSAGTSTAVTPAVCDPGDGTTAGCTAGKNYTVEPGYVDTIAILPLHMRSTGVFEPPPGTEWTCAIGATNGLGVVQLSSGTKTYDVTIVFDE